MLELKAATEEKIKKQNKTLVFKTRQRWGGGGAFKTQPNCGWEGSSQQGGPTRVGQDRWSPAPPLAAHSHTRETDQEARPSNHLQAPPLPGCNQIGYGSFNETQYHVLSVPSAVPAITRSSTQTRAKEGIDTKQEKKKKRKSQTDGKFISVGFQSRDLSPFHRPAGIWPVVVVVAAGGGGGGVRHTYSLPDMATGLRLLRAAERGQAGCDQASQLQPQHQYASTGLDTPPAAPPLVKMSICMKIMSITTRKSSCSPFTS